MTDAIQKRWFTLREAARYSSIGEQRLIAYAKEGKIKGFQDMDSGRKEWIFDRLSIDFYREGQASEPTIHEKALAIMKGVRL